MDSARRPRNAATDPHGNGSPSASGVEAGVGAGAASGSPSGTPCSDSLHLTQYSHLALLRAPQLGQIRKSAWLAFTVSFTLHPQRPATQGKSSPPPRGVGRARPDSAADRRARLD